MLNRPPIPLTAEEQIEVERDFLTSDAWRSHLGYDPNTAELPPGAIRISLIEYGAMEGRLYAVKTALNRGGDPNQNSFIYGTVLHAAAANGHFEIGQLLVDCGADLSRVNQSGITAFQAAEHEGHTEIAKYLQMKFYPSSGA